MLLKNSTFIIVIISVILFNDNLIFRLLTILLIQTNTQVVIVFGSSCFVKTPKRTCFEWVALIVMVCICFHRCLYDFFACLFTFCSQKVFEDPSICVCWRFFLFFRLSAKDLMSYKFSLFLVLLFILINWRNLHIDVNFYKHMKSGDK